MVAPAPAPKTKKTIDQCLADFHGCMTTSTMAPAPAARAPAPAPRAAASQYKTGTDNIARINKVFSAMQSQQGRSGATCDDAAKKFSNFWNSKGLVVVPAASGCPTGMVLPTGKDSTPIEGLVPCLPSGKTFRDLIGPGGLPSDLQTAMQACSQRPAAAAGDPCAGLTDGSLASSVSPACLQKLWKDKGCSEKGAAYPSNNYKGWWTQSPNGAATVWCDATHSGTQCGAGNFGAIKKDIEYWSTAPERVAGCKGAAAGGSGTSGYALEGSPFGGVVGGRNWKLILILLVLAIMLWIVAQKM